MLSQTLVLFSLVNYDVLNARLLCWLISIFELATVKVDV